MNPATSSLVQTGAGTSYWPPPLGVTGTVQSQQVSVVPQEVKPGWQVGRGRLSRRPGRLPGAVVPGACTHGMVQHRNASTKPEANLQARTARHAPLQLTVGLKAVDIYNNVMHLVLDTGVVMPSNISVCYTVQCE
jgi:hypothetical protein